MSRASVAPNEKPTTPDARSSWSGLRVEPVDRLPEVTHRLALVELREASQLRLGGQLGRLTLTEVWVWQERDISRHTKPHRQVSVRRDLPRRVVHHEYAWPAALIGRNKQRGQGFAGRDRHRRWGQWTILRGARSRILDGPSPESKRLRKLRHLAVARSFLRGARPWA